MRRRWALVLTGTAILVSAAVSHSSMGPPQAPVRRARLAPGPGVNVPANAELEQYRQYVQAALAPVLLPIATSWVRSQRGVGTEVALERIVVGPGGLILVVLDAWQGEAFTLYSLTYRWDNGWHLVEIESDV